MASSPTTNNNGTPSESRSLGADPIAWLQSRIGSYDVAHDLEPLVQKSVLKGLKHVPKRSGRIKTELIDLDLVRGSPFPKPNTQFCWDAFSKKSLLRFLLFPLFSRWWRQHLSQTVWLFFLFLYSLFGLVLLLFFADERLCRGVGVATTTTTTTAAATDDVLRNTSPSISAAKGDSASVASSSSSESPSSSPPPPPPPETFVLTELLLPFALAMALAFIHTQIVTGARFSPDYRHSSFDCAHNNGVSFGSPFLSSHAGGGGEHIVRRHRATSGGNHNNISGNHCGRRFGGGGGTIGLAAQRNLSPIRDACRSGYDGGAVPDGRDADQAGDDDVAALLDRCDVATLTQMDVASGDGTSCFNADHLGEMSRVNGDFSRAPDPSRDGLRLRRPLPDDSGVEDSGAATRFCPPESAGSADISIITMTSATAREEDEVAVSPVDLALLNGGSEACAVEDEEEDKESKAGQNRSDAHGTTPPIIATAAATAAPCCAGAHLACRGNVVDCRSGAKTTEPFQLPSCRDSSTSSDVGPQMVAPKTHFKLANNRDSTASVTDEETPSNTHLNHNPQNRLHHHSQFSHIPHSCVLNQPCPSSGCNHQPMTAHRRVAVPPSRLHSCSPSRRFGDVKKQLLQKNNRPTKKSIALDAMTLSSNNSDEDSEDEAILKSPSPRRNGHHHLHNGVFGARSHRSLNGAGGGGNAETTQWDSDDGVGGETDDGDSDTSHALGASSLVVPSSPYADDDDDDDADPLGGADLSSPDVPPGPNIDGPLGAAGGPKSQSRKSPPASNAASQSAASQQGKISCRIWEGNDVKKAHLSASDVSWIILEKVENLWFSSDYLVISALFSLTSAIFPLVFHIRSSPRGEGGGGSDSTSLPVDADLRWDELLSVGVLSQFFDGAFGRSWKERILIFTSTILRLLLSFLFLFLLSVAERTFKQRLLHAKFFCHLTSARRARASDLPHFRLNKVQNIKSWLSIRSFLKRRGPTRSVDIIVSVSFLVTCFLILFMCVEILKNPETFLDQLYNWEMMSWGLVLGFLMLRLITLGSKINKKYRNLSVLLTEQINLYLQMEQKPFKKEQFSLANNVLKLAAELLKELDTPFKISGIAANPLLYNISRVVILSAFSGVLTEMLGFKLKLWKIKMK